MLSPTCTGQKTRIFLEFKQTGSFSKTLLVKQFWCNFLQLILFNATFVGSTAHKCIVSFWLQWSIETARQREYWPVGVFQFAKVNLCNFDPNVDRDLHRAHIHFYLHFGHLFEHLTNQTVVCNGHLFILTCNFKCEWFVENAVSFDVHSISCSICN